MQGRRPEWALPGKRRRGDQECAPVPQEVIHEPALVDKQPIKVFSKQWKSQSSEFQKILKQWLHIPFPLFAYLCAECFQIDLQLGSCLGLRGRNEVGEKPAGHWLSSPVPSLLLECESRSPLQPGSPEPLLLPRALLGWRPARSLFKPRQLDRGQRQGDASVVHVTTRCKWVRLESSSWGNQDHLGN